MTSHPIRPRWADTPAQIVFEDAHIRVMFKPGGSDFLLLTFGNAEQLATGTRFNADKLVGRYGINCLGFMAHAANWFPTASMQAAARALAFTLAAFDIRMAYGSSLGAYAAIKHSARLGATHVVAFCPQWSIDPVECGAQDSGFRDHYRPEMTGMGIRPDEMSGSITIFYDPSHQPDAYHYTMLQNLSAQPRPDTLARCGVIPCRVHRVGHFIAPVLSGSELAISIFSACFAGDPSRLYMAVNPPRRASHYRRRHILTEAARRHPRLCLNAIYQLVREGQAHIPDGARCLLPLFLTLRQAAFPNLADELVACRLPHLSIPQRALLGSSAAECHSTRQAVMTAHGTVLHYSGLGGCLLHLSAGDVRLQTPGLCRVFIDPRGPAICIGPIIYLCRRLDEHRTDLVPLSNDLVSGCDVTSTGEGGVALRCGDHFASAELDGIIWWNALEPLAWEVFTPDEGIETADPVPHGVTKPP